MLLDRLLGRLQKIGSGSFSSVYDTNDGLVMKVPIKYDHRGDAQFLPLAQRMKVAKSIVVCTAWLHEKMGNVIVPAFLGAGGTIRQEKVVGVNYWDLPDNRQKAVNDKIDEIVLRALDLAERVPFEVGYIDSSHQNFMIDRNENVLWFDPWTPPDDSPMFDNTHPKRKSWT